MPTDSIISLDTLRKVYRGGGGDVVAVNDLSLDIPTGLTVLTGPSGCGKSTLINLVGAFDRPTSGTVSVAGVRVDQLRNSDLDRYRRETIGIVFQFFHLMPALTVLENAALPGELAGRSMRDAQIRAGELLDMVGLGHRLHHRPHELSGGEIQRTAIARALLNKPRVVLADEPTGNLDSRASETVMQLLAEVTAQVGASVLVATHDPDVVHRADRVIALRDGRVVDA